MRILFLSTWFPFPPNQGSKIRAFHLLNSLAGKHEVGLISFQDGELKDEWRNTIEEITTFTEVVPREPFAQNRIRSITGWLSPQPRAVFAGYSPEFSRRVREISNSWEPELIVALTFVTAPYAIEVRDIPRILDIDILLGLMLKEEFDLEQAPLAKARRHIAYQKFERYERRLFPKFDFCLVTSKRDRTHVMDDYGIKDNQIGLVPNGVNIDQFQPGLYPIEKDTLIFHGSLTYFANYDGIEYFLRSIFPLIRGQNPDARFTITGSTEGVDLDNLALDDHVKFTGYVENIRQILGRSRVCVVPLRKGAGTRIKILEAMAMGIPVVSTSKGAEGLDLKSGVHALIADDPIQFASDTVRLLSETDLSDTLSANAYKLVSERYSWSDIGEQFEAMVQSVAQARSHNG